MWNVIYFLRTFLFLNLIFRKCKQVWFQNARAKYRRNLLKQQQNGGAAVNDPAACPATSAASGDPLGTSGHQNSTLNDDSCSSSSGRLDGPASTGMPLDGSGAIVGGASMGGAIGGGAPLSPSGLSDISSTSASISALMAASAGQAMHLGHTTASSLDMHSLNHAPLMHPSQMMHNQMDHHHPHHQHQQHQHHQQQHHLLSDSSNVLGMYTSLHADL